MSLLRAFCCRIFDNEWADIGEDSDMEPGGGDVCVRIRTQGFGENLAGSSGYQTNNLMRDGTSDGDFDGIVPKSVGNEGGTDKGRD